MASAGTLPYESAMTELSLSMKERVTGSKNGLRKAFHIKTAQAGGRGRDLIESRAKNFRRHAERFMREEREQSPFDLTNLDSIDARGYQSGPDTNDRIVPVKLPAIRTHSADLLQKRVSRRSHRTLSRSSSSLCERQLAPSISSIRRKRASNSDLENGDDCNMNDNADSKTAGKVAHRQLSGVLEEIPTDIAMKSVESVPRSDIVQPGTVLQGKESQTRKHVKRRKQATEVNGNMLPRKLGLEEVVKDKTALAAFRIFLRSERSEENMEFWLECEEYKSLKGSKQAKVANKIFTEYIADNAKKQVNLDAALRFSTEQAVKNPDKTTFMEAQRSIFNLMRADSFMRFKSHEIYSKYVEIKPKTKTKLFS